MYDTAPAPRRALPPAVTALALRCGAGAPSGDQVVITQTGSMRADAAHRWASFHARQSIDLDRPGFAWRATTGPLGCIGITDALEETGAKLSVSALGFIPIVRAVANEALTRGELQRYLAEIALVPDAILQNTALEWEVLSPSTLRVAATHGGVRAHVDLALGPEGLVASIAADRPRLEGAVSVVRPWTGRFSDYREHQGRQIPFAAEVAWTLGGEEVAYWRGVMTSWELGVRK